MSRITRFSTFPLALKQTDRELGCIPTNLAAVLQAYGVSEASESLIQKAYRYAICFEKVKSGVLDKLGEMIDQNLSQRFRLEHHSNIQGFDDWWARLAECIDRDSAVLFSYNASGSWHIATAIGYDSEKLEAYDPWPDSPKQVIEVRKSELEQKWTSKKLAGEILAVGQINEGTASSESYDGDRVLDQYTRLLDSLARFYNSQISAHVGYTITVSAAVVGTAWALISSIVLRPEQIALRLGPISAPESWSIAFDLIIRVMALAIVFAGVPTFFLVGFSRFSFEYLYGRTQYYIALSEIVSNHIGLKTQGAWRSAYAERWRKKALSYEAGIENAIICQFEANLFLSRCVQHKGFEKLLEDDKWVDKYLAAFDLTVDALGPWTRKGPYTRTILGRWRLVDLLYLAYKPRIEEYCKEERKEPTEDARGKRKRKVKGVLLKLDFELADKLMTAEVPCPRCGSAAQYSPSKQYYCVNCQISFSQSGLSEPGEEE
jgi:hypothetical protein